MRDEDREISFKFIGGKVVYEVRIPSNVQRVKFVSSPTGAEVYAIPLYDYEGVSDPEILLTAKYRIPEGNTNTASQLSTMMEYRIIFIRKAKRQVRKCEPAIHSTVWAGFQ